MSAAAVTALMALPAPPSIFDEVFALVIDSVENRHTKRMYGAALSEFLVWCTEQHVRLDRAGVHKWRSELLTRGLLPNTINLRLTAIRKLAREAAIHRFLDPDTAAAVVSVENVKQTGVSRGNWLNLQQAQKLILAPDVAKLKGVRDRAILAILVGCGLRREEAARLTFADVQQRDGRWVIVDLRGKRGRIRTVPMPAWVKTAIDLWAAAAQISTGRILRAMSRHGYISHDTMTPEAVLHVVEEYGRKIGIAIKAHDMRRTCASLSRKAGGQLEQIQLLLGHSSVQTTERYLGTTQDLEHAPNDRVELGWKESE
jgi:integrase